MANNPFLNESSTLTSLGATSVNDVNLSFSTAASELALTGSTSLSASSRRAAINPSSERLFMARSRSSDSKESGPEGRGQWAYIKLLTNDILSKAYAAGDLSKRGISASNPRELMEFADNMAQSGARGYDKFLLTGISGSFNEKVQVTQVFGDGEVSYYFGRQPMIINFSGLLIDSPDNTWFTDWMRMYSEFLRGTQLARNFEMLKIVLPNMIMTGSITGMSWQQNSDRDTDIPFSFQFLANRIEPVLITAPNMVYNNGVQKIKFDKVSTFFSQSSINALKSNVDAFEAIKIIQDPASSLAQRAAALSSIGGGLSGAAADAKTTSDGSIIDQWTKDAKSGTLGVLNSPLFQGIGASLDGIRSSLFSPIYGVLSSLTKLVTTVTKGASAIFASLVTPVRNVLRDITDLSERAISLVRTVNSSINGFGRYTKGELNGLSQDYKTALKTMNKAAGVIATAPSTVTQSIAHMFETGTLPFNVAFLKSNSKGSLSQSSVLGSHGTSLSRAAILKSGAPYSPAAAAVLYK